VGLDRRDLLSGSGRQGAAWCAAHVERVDAWLREVFAEATEGRDGGAALVAIGGYGRGDLCPQSDLDLLLVHDRRYPAEALAPRIWYPIWDAGFHLGHKVATVKQSLALAREDLDTATSLLTCRAIAGDAGLAEEVAERAAAQWLDRRRHGLAQLAERVALRHRSVGDVAFAMEPELKEGRGGLRDVHSLWWAERAGPVFVDDDADLVGAAYERLLAVRVELHLRAGRATNTVTLAEREEIAGALGYAGGDALMAGIAEAGRSIGWRSDDLWRRVLRSLSAGTRRGAPSAAAPRMGAFAVRDGEVHVADPSAASQPGAVLEAAVTATTAGAALSREVLRALAVEGRPISEWTEPLRARLVELLRSGRVLIPIVEALDQVGVWSGHVLPEWAAVRSLPQHNPFHRFTVDRHLLEAVANAGALAGTVERPDLLVLAALLHDLGKGRSGDHTAAGVAIAGDLLVRLGLPSEDVATVVLLVRHHLLLADVATRRDLDDPATLRLVARAVGDVERLHLLAALTRADAEATGPAAWTPWRAELVDRLVTHVEHHLLGGEAPPAAGGTDRAALLDLLARGETRIDGAGDTITVVTDDRPGVFSRVAGVLALHGLEVLAATALSDDRGRAASRFTVTDPMRGEPPWDKVERDVARAVRGELAIRARLAERAERYRRPSVRAGATGPATVTFDDGASSSSTVVDVYTADAAGVLYRITAALAELDLDIRSARVQTVGADVVDAFYLRDREGGRIDDPQRRQEIALAITHALAAPD
jgi:[protein-PII] uridylyltransferase